MGGGGGGQAGWGGVLHVADHCWGAWAEVDEVVLGGLTQHLAKGKFIASFLNESRRGGSR